MEEKFFKNLNCNNFLIYKKFFYLVKISIQKSIKYNKFNSANSLKSFIIHYYFRNKVRNVEHHGIIIIKQVQNNYEALIDANIDLIDLPAHIPNSLYQALTNRNFLL